MSLSIQGRLTAWYAGALLAALTLCGFVLYAAVVRLEISSVDEDLRRAASTIAFSMKAEEAAGLNLQAAGTDTVNELRIAGITLAIYETQGHLLAARWGHALALGLDAPGQPVLTHRWLGATPSDRPTLIAPYRSLSCAARPARHSVGAAPSRPGRA